MSNTIDLANPAFALPCSQWFCGWRCQARVNEKPYIPMGAYRKH